MSITKDFSISAIIAGFIAVMISYAGPSLIIFSAANNAHLTTAQITSWVWAVSIGSGLSGLALSLKYRAPVITAWSTPGAALLLTSLPTTSYSNAIGAFLFASMIIFLLAITGAFDKLMAKIPKAIAASMLAGILFKFALGIFSSVNDQVALVITMFLAFIICRRLTPRYTIPVVLLIGLGISYGLNLLHIEQLKLELAMPLFTMPTFSLQSLLSIGIPLALVTMSGQFVPGIAVMRNANYSTPSKPMVGFTSFLSILLAPFGSHGVNLAAITAAICTGREAHELPEKRYIAGITCGLAYIIIGLFGGTLVMLFTALPKALVASIAGLALLGSLMNSLSTAMGNEHEREAALITFVVTASGMTLLSMGSPFWGLIAGMIAKKVLHKNS